MQNAVFMPSTLPEELFHIKLKLLYYKQIMSQRGTCHKGTICNQKKILVKFCNEKGSEYSNCYGMCFWDTEGKAQRMGTEKSYREYK